MLENFLEVEGIQKLTRTEQKIIHGGDAPVDPEIDKGGKGDL
ncbi:hypothetical protein OIU83_00295 [Flavobacterium sp. LS1R49]|uniref:Uncharacterized protein n=1 Tax=Flavobacterium shii TaxID=2987687 RepID=A0A9X2ZE93_9FLAO|nr:hypothetical protein [Flavobacterium shii]MCV9926078.1 hypothetical protein [Flavobacterium shii]